VTAVGRSSDHVDEWSERLRAGLGCGFASTSCNPDQTASASESFAPGFGDRAIQAVREPGMSLCEGPWTWSEALLVGQSSWGATCSTADRSNGGHGMTWCPPSTGPTAGDPAVCMALCALFRGVVFWADRRDSGVQGHVALPGHACLERCSRTESRRSSPVRSGGERKARRRDLKA
jgi:hypothetical protein